MNIKEALSRYFRLRRVATGKIHEGSAPLEERIEILKKIFKLINDPVDHSALLLFSYAVQEAHFASTHDLVDGPYTRTVEYNSEKVEELLWKLQGSEASLTKLSNSIDLEPRDILLKARRVVREEPKMSFGDWSLIRQSAESILFKRGFKEKHVIDVGTLVVSILEESNGNPSVASARLELGRNRPTPDIHVVSPLWKK